jgi:arylsulfatase A-like enzyme
MRAAVVVVSLGLCLAGGCGKNADPQQAQKLRTAADSPNVVLISIDMLRPDHLHCYGYERATSPQLDQVAAEGVLFENHISSTCWTLPAHAAMFTSLSDSVHGCTDTDRKLPDDMVTLAERFHAAGYTTAGFFSGPYLHPAFGLGQGFEHYENCTSYAAALDENAVEQWAMDSGVMHESHHDVTSPRLFAAVKRWLDANGGSKFFMFVHMWDPHFDFIPPAPYDKMFDPDYAGTLTGEDFFFNAQVNADMPARDLQHLLALYDGEIAWTDLHVGKIIDELRRAGLLDTTVVAITSDHGTEFFEHGAKGHRQALFDESIRAPLMIRYPASLPAGLRVGPQTRLIDVGATLLELAGVPVGEGEIMGHSLVPLVRTGTPGFDNLAVSELFSVGREMRSIRTLDWKFTDLMLMKGQRMDRAFYVNLRDDPGEQQLMWDFNLAAARRLVEQYRAVVDEQAAWTERIAVQAEKSTIPGDVRRSLESLGYVSCESEGDEHATITSAPAATTQPAP